MLMSFFRKKRAHRTMSAGQGSRPGPKVEADMGRASGAPPTEDADGLSATNSGVESALNHRHRRVVLRDACFPQRRWTPLIQEMRISVLLKMV